MPLPEESQDVVPAGLVWVTVPLELNVVVVPNQPPVLEVIVPVLGS